MKRYDVVIVGAGMAGASLAAELAEQVSVLVVEKEEFPGYHSTGRSAAFWTETYGGPLIQPLTTASGKWLGSPPLEISDRGFLSERRALNIGTASDCVALDQFVSEFAASDVSMERYDRTAMEKFVSGLRPELTDAVFEPDCCDIDVGGLHGAYLSRARKLGAEIQCSSAVEAAKRAGDGWTMNISGDEVGTNILVNAAGAWADQLAANCAVQPLGIIPYRRTMIQLRVEPAVRMDMPLIVDINGNFYFKPEAGGRLWLSPHDETRVPAGDVGAEEMDVAIAIDHFQKTVDWKIEAVERKWAGLRSFAPDRLPVYGFDPLAEGFYWFAGQGGVGIQTAPAAAKIAKAQILGTTPEVLVADIDAETYSPDRFPM